MFPVGWLAEELVLLTEYLSIDCCTWLYKPEFQVSFDN